MQVSTLTKVAQPQLLASNGPIIYRLPGLRAIYRKPRLVTEDWRMPHENMMRGLAEAFSHIDPEKVTNGQIYSLLYSMRAQQIESNVKIEALTQELADHKKELKEIKVAWDTSQNVIKFVKFLGTIGLPVAGVLAIAKFLLGKIGLWP